jgi:ubiquinone/menaquinone biosynthesis C-methylase UbiE
MQPLRSLVDQTQLAEQYKSSANLNARAQLHQRFSTNKYGWMRWVFDQLALLGPHSRVLEVGCGPGWLWRENLPRIPVGWQITLGDFSPGMVAEAEAGLQGSGRDFSFEVMDVQSLPFAAESFDAVIANHMLYHVPDLARAFSEVRRVLKPGGSFYAATNGERHLQELNALYLRFAPQLDLGERRFTLENGVARMGAWFPEVEVRRYESALVVTEAEPLLAYALSGIVGDAIQGEGRAALTQFIAEEIAREGAIRISQDAGLFVARKAPEGHNSGEES